MWPQSMFPVFINTHNSNILKKTDIEWLQKCRKSKKVNFPILGEIIVPKSGRGAALRRVAGNKPGRHPRGGKNSTQRVGREGNREGQQFGPP